MSEHEQYVSLDPEQHSAGGYLDDADVTIVEAAIVAFDYDGKAEARCCMMARYRPDLDEGESREEEDEDDRVEYYSMGALAKFTPNDDGSRAVPVVDGARISNKSKASLFCVALKKIGINLVELEKDFRSLSGTRVHVNHQPLPAFKDKATGEDVSGKTILVPTALLEDGGGGGGKKAAKATKPSKPSKPSKPAKAAKAAKPAAAAKPTPAADAGGDDGGDDDPDTAAALFVLGVLEAEGGTVSKSNLPARAFRELKGNPALSKIAKLITNDAWLGDDDRPWTYEGGELSKSDEDE